MSDNVDQNARLRQHFKDRDAQKAESQAGLRPQKVGDPTSPCKDTPPPDPEIEECITVWDSESKGARYWDEATRTLHIVQTAHTDTVELQYTGPRPPAKLEVYCNDKLKTTLPGGTRWSYDITYAPEADPYNGLTGALLPLREIATFSASVTTWVFRSDSFKAYVKVYNPDQWKLTIKTLPRHKGQKLSEEWSSKDATRTTVTTATSSSSKADGVRESKSTTSRGAAKDGSLEVNTTTQEATHSKGGTTISLKSTSLDAKSSQIADLVYDDATGSYIAGQVQVDTKVSGKSVSINSGKSGPQNFLPKNDFVTLTRNSKTLELDALNYIGAALALVAAFQQIKKTIHNNVPEIGWSWDVEFAVLEGEATFTWGWQEHTDHRVYYGMGLGVSTKLVSIKGKIAVGVKKRGLQGQVVLEAGGAITVEEGPTEWRLGLGLDDAVPDNIQIGNITGKIELTIYIAVAAGELASVNAGGRSTLLQVDGKLSWNAEENFVLNAGCAFKGIEIFATLKIKFFPDQDVSFEIMAARDLGSLRLPKKGLPDTDEYAGPESIETAVKDGFEISFWDWNDPEFHNTITYTRYKKSLLSNKMTAKTVTEQVAVSRDTVYARIASRIWEHKDRIELTKETVEGLIYGIRADVVAYGSSVEYDDLLNYLSSAAFEQRLQDAECPAKCTMIDAGLT